MKKVFLSLAVLASVAMVSCNKKAAEGENVEAQAENTENCDSTACKNDTCANCDTVVVADTVVVDSVA